MAHHDNRASQMGAWVVINACWYYSSTSLTNREFATSVSLQRFHNIPENLKIPPIQQPARSRKFDLMLEVMALGRRLKDWRQVQGEIGICSPDRLCLMLLVYPLMAHD